MPQPNLTNSTAKHSTPCQRFEQSHCHLMPLVWVCGDTLLVCVGRLESAYSWRWLCADAVCVCVQVHPAFGWCSMGPGVPQLGTGHACGCPVLALRCELLPHGLPDPAAVGHAAAAAAQTLRAHATALWLCWRLCGRQRPAWFVQPVSSACRWGTPAGSGTVRLTLLPVLHIRAWVHVGKVCCMSFSLECWGSRHQPLLLTGRSRCHCRAAAGE